MSGQRWTDGVCLLHAVDFPLSTKKRERRERIRITAPARAATDPRGHFLRS